LWGRIGLGWLAGCLQAAMRLQESGSFELS
jgi:hypothetical protein